MNQFINGQGDDALLRMASEIVSGFVSHNALPREALPGLINTVHKTLLDLAREENNSIAPQKPAVPIEKSVQGDYIVCLEDGKKLKMLKRHLRSQFGMSPDQYRAKWGLPPDYPMVAPNYAEERSKLAKEIGLGKSPNYKNGKK